MAKFVVLKIIDRKSRAEDKIVHNVAGHQVGVSRWLEFDVKGGLATKLLGCVELLVQQAQVIHRNGTLARPIRVRAGARANVLVAQLWRHVDKDAHVRSEANLVVVRLIGILICELKF